MFLSSDDLWSIRIKTPSYQNNNKHPWIHLLSSEIVFVLLRWREPLNQKSSYQNSSEHSLKNGKYHSILEITNHHLKCYCLFTIYSAYASTIFLSKHQQTWIDDLVFYSILNLLLSSYDLCTMRIKNVVIQTATKHWFHEPKQKKSLMIIRNLFCPVTIHGASESIISLFKQQHLLMNDSMFSFIWNAIVCSRWMEHPSQKSSYQNINEYW